MAAAAARISVVTGGNKGIGFQICKQLASNGIKVVLTARDEKRGLEAVKKLREFGEVTFHQLDVTHPASIAALADFIKTQFGKLDILVNNAGIPGYNVDRAALAAGGRGGNVDWSKIATQTNELIEACFATNYYGAKGMCEALLPLLELSESPRIVNVSSSLGNLSGIPMGWAKEILSDAKSLTEEKLDEILNQFLKDFKDGSLETKGCWPSMLSGYSISKAVLNGYTRILAKKHPSIPINAVCPGFVKSDFNSNTGYYSPESGAACIVRVALLPDAAPSGLFFSRTEAAPF